MPNCKYTHNKRHFIKKSIFTPKKILNNCTQHSANRSNSFSIHNGLDGYAAVVQTYFLVVGMTADPRVF